MNVVLKHQLQQQIFAEMVASYPNEGGGFLVGTLEGDNVRIEDVVHITNTFSAEEQYHRYAMTPQDWARLEDQADERGLTLVGYYHSHPDSPAIPSIYDRDHALPNFTYIITSVLNTTGTPAPAEQRVWRLRADRTQFDEATLIVE